MNDFYLIASVIADIFLFLIWTKNDLFNFLLKILFLTLSITGSLVVINTYHLIH